MKTIRIGYFLMAMIALSATAQLSQAVELVGYLPDYRMGGGSWEPPYVKNILSKQLPLVDEVRYFGLETDKDGKLKGGHGTTMKIHIANIETLKKKIAALPKDQRPRLVITLGGWGKSAGFGPVAGSKEKRQALADNIKKFLDTHKLDGVDLDWEHPNGGQLNNAYPALIATIKKTLGPKLLVSAALAPSKVLPRKAFEGKNAIDCASIMTYDLHWKAPGGKGPHSTQKSTVASLKAWSGRPKNRLGVGIPFYGRGIPPADPGWAVEYKTLRKKGTTKDGNTYKHSTGVFWITGPKLVEERIRWANEQGLREVILWELWHDLDPSEKDSLLRIAYETNKACEKKANEKK